MNKRKLNYSEKTSRGFSLPEVAIAIGIAGLALISVLGLMPSLLDSDRVSGLNTALPQLMTQAMGELRSQPYPENPPITGTLYFSESCELTTENADGIKVPIYRCNYTISPITNASGVVSAGKNSCIVKLDFIYHAEPNSTPKTFHAAISKS